MYLLVKAVRGQSEAHYNSHLYTLECWTINNGWNASLPTLREGPDACGGVVADSGEVLVVRRESNSTPRMAFRCAGHVVMLFMFGTSVGRT